MKTYITGISGTGKSTISEELIKRGFYSIDIDLRKFDLCHWENKETRERAHYEYGIGLDFLKMNGWYCDIDKLKELININKDVYVFGMAENQKDFLGLFDRILLLQCDEKIFFERIDNRTTNNYGKDSSEKEYIMSFYKDFEEDIINRGAITINTEDSLESIIEKVTCKN